MKEFKLAAWPELPATYHRTAYRRMLSDMSQRHASVPQLMAASGASRLQVEFFLQMLARRGVLLEREAARGSVLGALRPLAARLQRAWAEAAGRR